VAALFCSRLKISSRFEAIIPTGNKLQPVAFPLQLDELMTVDKKCAIASGCACAHQSEGTDCVQRVAKNAYPMGKTCTFDQ